MADRFQKMLFEKYIDCFPEKTLKVCDEDKPWISLELKKLDQQMKREFWKHKKSSKWYELKSSFEEKCQTQKEKYYDNIVHDLKTSNPGKWYSKVKRMAGIQTDAGQNITLEELDGYSHEEQADIIAKHYSDISNEYEPIQEQQFSEYFNLLSNENSPPEIQPHEVNKIIGKLNKKSATVQNDIPVKLLCEFSVEISFPLAHIINFCLKNGTYPKLWKLESVTPVPKIFPPEKLKDLRKISGLPHCAKVLDKVISNYLIMDMAPNRDLAQYGNEKKLSSQHYLVKLIHRIVTVIDRNSKSEAMAVIATMVDWSQAFDRQCHTLGIKAFIANGVRSSLIPILVSFFKERKMRVKWNGAVSSEHSLNGGSPQGDVLGILEYLAQTNNNTDFLSVDDKFKFIDDLTFLDILNLMMLGLISYDHQVHVASDVSEDNQFLPASNLKTQQYLEEIDAWTDQNQLKINSNKTKYMIFNNTRNYQFNTRLHLHHTVLDQIKEAKLLGVIISDNLSWDSNTDFITKKAYKTMTILHNLSSFDLPLDELVNIYVLYTRSVVEYCAVVWHSALTEANRYAIERVQKVALKIILGEEYESYEQALEVTGLQTLEDRRRELCKRFAKNCLRNPKTTNMFPRKPSSGHNTRVPEKFVVQKARTDTLRMSAIPYMQRLLNQQ